MPRPAHRGRPVQTSDRPPPPSDLTREGALVAVSTAPTSSWRARLVCLRTLRHSRAHTPLLQRATRQPRSDSPTGWRAAILRGPGKPTVPFRYCSHATLMLSHQLSSWCNNYYPRCLALRRQRSKHPSPHSHGNPLGNLGSGPRVVEPADRGDCRCIIPSNC